MLRTLPVGLVPGRPLCPSCEPDPCDWTDGPAAYGPCQRCGAGTFYWVPPARGGDPAPDPEESPATVQVLVASTLEPEELPATVPAPEDEPACAECEAPFGCEPGRCVVAERAADPTGLHAILDEEVGGIGPAFLRQLEAAAPHLSWSDALLAARELLDAASASGGPGVVLRWLQSLRTELELRKAPEYQITTQDLPLPGHPEELIPPSGIGPWELVYSVPSALVVQVEGRWVQTLVCTWVRREQAVSPPV